MRRSGAVRGLGSMKRTPTTAADPIGWAGTTAQARPVTTGGSMAPRGLWLAHKLSSWRRHRRSRPDTTTWNQGSPCEPRSTGNGNIHAARRPASSLDRFVTGAAFGRKNSTRLAARRSGGNSYATSTWPCCREPGYGAGWRDKPRRPAVYNTLGVMQCILTSSVPSAVVVWFVQTSAHRRSIARVIHGQPFSIGSSAFNAAPAFRRIWAFASTASPRKLPSANGSSSTARFPRAARPASRVRRSHHRPHSDA